MSTSREIINVSPFSRKNPSEPNAHRACARSSCGQCLCAARPMPPGYSLAKHTWGASWGAVEMRQRSGWRGRKKQCSLRSHLDPRRSLPLHPLHILHILHILRRRHRRRHPRTPLTFFSIFLARFLATQNIFSTSLPFFPRNFLMTCCQLGKKFFSLFSFSLSSPSSSEW